MKKSYFLMSTFILAAVFFVLHSCVLRESARIPSQSCSRSFDHKKQNTFGIGYGELSDIKLSELSSVELESVFARLFIVGVAMETTFGEPVRQILDKGVSGVILFQRNFLNANQIKSFNDEMKEYAEKSGRSLLVTVNQEGGRVSHLKSPFCPMPSSLVAAGLRSESFMHLYGQMVGEELKDAQFDMNLAPVLDVNTNPNNPVIGDRSFGDDPETVSIMGASYLKGLQSARVTGCVKHFPGHGDTFVDSHLGLPRVDMAEAQLLDVHVRPFWRALNLTELSDKQEGQMACVMTSHIVFSSIDSEPATSSRVIITDLLKKKMGFNGLVLSDSMEMKAISNDNSDLIAAIIKSLHAGVHAFLLPHNPSLPAPTFSALAKAFRSGLIRTDSVLDALRMVDTFMRTRVRLSSASTRKSLLYIGTSTHVSVCRALLIDSKRTATLEQEEWIGNRY